MEKRTYCNLWYLIAAVLGVLWRRDTWVTVTQVEPIPYSQFQQDLKDGRSKNIAISANTIQGSYKDVRPEGRAIRQRGQSPVARRLSHDAFHP